jgi:hypothetical protein
VVRCLAFIESAVDGAGFEDVWSFTQTNPAMTFIPLLPSGELTEQLITGHEEVYLRHLWNTFTANKDRATFDSWAPYLAALKRPGLIRSGANYYRGVYAGADAVRQLIGTCKLTIPVLSVAGSASFGAGRRALVDAFADNVVERSSSRATGTSSPRNNPTLCSLCCRSFLISQNRTDGDRPRADGVPGCQPTDTDRDNDSTGAAHSAGLLGWLSDMATDRSRRTQDRWAVPSCTRRLHTLQR